jgi:hypothetical protein
MDEETWPRWTLSQGSDLQAMDALARCLFFFLLMRSDLVRHVCRSDLDEAFPTRTPPRSPNRQEQENVAHEPRKKKEINETQYKIQIQNYYAEKIEEPRLRQIGRKDTRKDD